MKGKIILSTLLLCIMTVLLCGCGGGSDDDGGNYGGTCQFDGCSRKAVGPTYEFCSSHKKALNDYWDVQYQQGNY